MTQYLLSVHGNEGAIRRGGGPEQMQEMFAATGRFNPKLRAAGAWVFGGGLSRRTQSATVVAARLQGRSTDGPYLETKEHLGGFWVIEASDLDAALRVGGGGIGGVQGPGRGAAVPGRVRPEPSCPRS